jgi:4-oxalomesaconate tautomerase
MILVAPPRDGGAIATRSFIPHRAHATIGVFAALSVATACLLPEGPASEVAAVPDGAKKRMLVEHPTGASPVSLVVDEAGQVVEGALISTARLLFSGHVHVPARATLFGKPA